MIRNTPNQKVNNKKEGKKMINELGAVCDKLKVAGTFAPHTEI